MNILRFSQKKFFLFLFKKVKRKKFLSGVGLGWGMGVRVWEGIETRAKE
jgi:hypothetical protein